MARGAKLDFPESLPLAVRISVALLVLMLWQRNAGAAAAGAQASGARPNTPPTISTSPRAPREPAIGRRRP